MDTAPNNQRRQEANPGATTNSQVKKEEGVAAEESKVPATLTRKKEYGTLNIRLLGTFEPSLAPGGLAGQ